MAHTKRQLLKLVLLAASASLAVAAAATAAAATAAAGIPSPPHVHLLVDEQVVRDRGAAAPRLGPVSKSKANPLLREDRQWEGSWKNTNPSIVYRDGVFHLWMTANLVCPGTSPSNPTKCAHPTYNYTVPNATHSDGGLLYARSTDGIRFEKPTLGLVEVFGSKQNNVVYRTGGGPAQTGVWFDERAGVFRMFGKNLWVGTGGGVGVASSFDGIHNWTNFTPAASMGLSHGADTSNNALWDETLQRYIAFSRERLSLPSSPTPTLCSMCANPDHAVFSPSDCVYHVWAIQFINSIGIDSKVPPQYGERRESRSTAEAWEGPWSKAVQVLEGEVGYEAYALVPFRLPGWRPGLYMGLAAFFSASVRVSSVRSVAESSGLLQARTSERLLLVNQPLAVFWQGRSSGLCSSLLCCRD
jgi:hypothetical protein